MTADLIPLEVLLGDPQKTNPQISPDGKRTSYLAPHDGVMNVWVGTVGTVDHRPVTNDKERGIHTYTWCHDNRHLLYTQDQGGDENWRVYTVDVDSGQSVDRTPFEGVQAQLLAHRKPFPNEVLIGLNRDNPQLHDVYHLDLNTGELKKVADNPGFVAWVVDAELKVRCAVAPQPDGGFAIVVRDNEESEWKPLLVISSDDALSTGPMGFTRDGKSMFLQSSIDANAARLVRMNIETGEQDVLAEDPTYDVVNALIHPDTREPQIAFLLKEKIDYVVLDESIRDDVAAIRKIAPDNDFHIVDRDHADATWLIAFDDDDGPVRYHTYDRATKQATFLFDHHPDLNDYTLAPVEPFSYKARDGLEVHGYLTFPPGDDRSALPTVINVHGGPWYRDTWGFNPESQWLANRGYLSVQVNFRGSIGYGKDFVNAGDREWGGKMQDDLTDAVRFVIDQGYADADRVAIIGGSYGGYATLVGATFTPELYRCAVSMVGPSSLKTWIETVPPYWAPMIAMLKKRVGDPETDEEFLWSRSPLSKVDSLSIPLFIAHGANDPRVKLSETEQIVEAMKKKGIDHELMVFEDEGHGFVRPENRLKFYTAAEKFLAKYLGGPHRVSVPDLIPLEVLFGNPDKMQPQLSPDGRRLAYIAPVDGVLNVWVGAVGSEDFKPVTDDRDRGIRAYGWCWDDKHVVYIQDVGGDENWRLYSVDLDTGDIRDRTPFEDVQARAIAFRKEHPHELLVGLNKDNKELHDVYHLDLRTGALELRVKNPGFIGWLADVDLNVRGALRVTDDGVREVMVREIEDVDWRVVASFDFEDSEMSAPVGFSRDGRRLFMRSATGANAARLVELDLETGAERVLAEDAVADVVGVMTHPDTREPQMVTFLKDRRERVVLDPSVAGDLAAIEQIDEGDFGISGRDRDDRVWMVVFNKDDGPTRYYTFDRDTTQAAFLFESRPELNAYELAKMEPFSFAARDGLQIHGYITFPVGVERRNLPAVLVVHGGPWSRDVWGFHPYAQWMANRGYVCIQVNYRGSVGYGKAHLNAGDREWGAKMHDDLLDAIDWAVGKGFIDRDRVGIFGGSYGGYAALVGATFTPDVFRCAVDIVGPSNLITLLETVPPYWKPNIVRFHKRLGHPEKDKDFLWSRSPLSRVDAIKIPLLIGQGANDPRVKQAESEQIVAAMTAKGIDHEYMLFPDEGHGFAKPDNRLKFCAAAEKFLAKHLGGRAG